MVQEESLRPLYELCHERFEYKEGKIYFKDNFHSRQRKGSEAGHIGQGYYRIMLNRKFYLVHRLIFLMFHGYLPELIDHIDQNSLNNRIENLRDADKEINSWNTGIQSNNTSGVRGVSWNKNANKWHAYIKVKGVRHHIGLFTELDDAKRAYEQERFKFRGDEGITS